MATHAVFVRRENGRVFVPLMVVTILVGTILT